MEEHIIALVFKDARATTLLQAIDVFEPWKVVATKVPAKVEVGERFTLADCLNKIREAAGESGLSLVAIFAPGKPDGAWHDPHVKVISDGKRWGLFHDYLRHWGYIGPLEEEGSDAH